MRGPNDAPRASEMRLSRSLKQIGYHREVTDPQIWRVQQSCWPCSKRTRWLSLGHGQHDIHAHRRHETK
eukprot:3651038-Prorocentrum_lima.AAC.1